MLTKKGLDALGDAVNFGHRVGFNPFTYSNTHLALPAKKFRQVRFSINVLINFLYFWYTLTKLVLACLAPIETRKYSELFWLGIYSTGQFWGLANMILIWNKRHETVCFFSSMVEFSKKIISSSKEFEMRAPTSKIRKHVDVLQFLVRYLRMCITFVAFSSTMMFIAKPSLPQFIYSSLSQSSAQERPKLFPDFIFLVLLEYHHKLSLQSAIVVESQLVLVMYIMFSSWILSRIHASNCKNIKGSMRNYRFVHILSKVHRDSTGSATSLMFMSFGMIWMFGAIGTLRLYHVVDILDYSILCIIAVSGSVLFGIIHFCGNIPMICRMVVTDFRHNYNRNVTSGERKYLTKTAMSLQLFGIRCTPIRLLKHNAIYLYFGSLINMIVTILVANEALGKI